MYFRSRCFMYIFVLDDFETSNLESFNMYFHKGGSKESQNKNIMYVRSGLKKKLVNFETSNNVTEPQVLYVHKRGSQEKTACTVLTLPFPWTPPN